MGTAHLGEARCICAANPEGCPLHQRVVAVDLAAIPDEGVELAADDKLPGFPPYFEPAWTIDGE